MDVRTLLCNEVLEAQKTVFQLMPQLREMCRIWFRYFFLLIPESHPAMRRR